MNDITPIEQAGKELLADTRISPESLEVAETYLRLNDIYSVASTLGMEANEVADVLNKREVQKFIDTVYMDIGYRNRAKLGTALDKIIDAKLEEMDEAEITSSKDISELLHLAHKMRMDEMKLQIELLKLEEKNREVVRPGGTVVNIQDNSGFGGNYGLLMDKIINGEKKKGNN